MIFRNKQTYEQKEWDFQEGVFSFCVKNHWESLSCTQGIV